jgi:hypothetical protein
VRLRPLVLLVVLAVVVGVGVATWRGSGPLPAPEGCSAQLKGLRVDLSPEQARNATLIAAVGVRRGLPARAVSIALATAYQESKIVNLRYGDRDSLGLFQQRPSQGWGTAAQIQDEYYAINAFYDALERIDGYQGMRITEAAQRVQRSGFPEAYEDHAADARALASVLTGYSGGGRFSCVVREPGSPGRSERVVQSLERAFGGLDTSTGPRRDVTVRVGGGEAGARRGWAIAQFVVAHAARLGPVAVEHDGRRWRTGNDSAAGWAEADGVAGAGSVVVRLG